MAVTLPIGFDFRRTSGYVTDVSPNVPILGSSDAYSSGVGYGWSVATSLARDDRSTSVDARLAGMNYVANNLGLSANEFRVDTGPGTFRIRLALGDSIDLIGPHQAQFFDGAGTTPILTVSVGGTTVGQWYDATGVLRTSASDWVTNNAAATVTLTSSYLRMQIGAGSGASSTQYTGISHLAIAAAPVPNAPSGVSVSSVGPYSATASWTDNSSDETGFKVQVAASPYSTWTSVATTAANATSQAVTGLTDGTAYKVRVASTNANGDSAWVESGIFTTTALTKLRPSATTSAGAWTAVGAASLHAAINETPASDSEYATTSAASTMKVKIANASSPGTTANHSFQYRCKGDGVSQLKVDLVQGDPSETLIKTTTITPTTSFATYTVSLTTGEAGTITDYTALYFKFTSL